MTQNTVPPAPPHSPADRKLINQVRAVIVTPIAFLIVAIVGGVLITSEALPKSLSGVLRFPGQSLPLLAVAILTVGVILLRRQGRWRPGFAFYFAGGALAQLAPLLLLMHHHPVTLIAPLVPGAVIAAYSVFDRRGQGNEVH
ncbi:hypothetical protein [Streptomyces sp. NPDC051214]|uniref:hypothetical protein n=1 Tax=Streptomyces sp. NPDC051214 TaxID=3155282 RepID=UPI0034461428